MMLTAILLIFICTILICLYIKNECRRPAKFPPGPPWTPFIGNGPELRKLAKLFGGQHHAYMELARKYSTEVVGLKLGKERVVCACSYATVRQVLVSDEFIGRPDNFFFRMRTMGLRNGITGTDGDLWKEQRSFLMSHLRSLGYGKNTMEEMIKHEIQDLITLIENSTKSINLNTKIAPLVLNILWHLTGGKGVKSNSQIERLLELLEIRSKAFDISGGTLNNYPWLRFIAPEKSGYNLLLSVNRQIIYFLTEVINEHKVDWREGGNDDVIYAFLSEMEKVKDQPSYFTEEQLIMVCLDILIAGATTTSTTIDFAFLAMILYPEVQDKVQQCLDYEFRKDENITYRDRQRVPYIEAVLLECQRYFPVMPVIGPRRAVKTTHLDEYIIPENTTVLINIHAVHSDRDFWTEPEKFMPERFLDANGNLISQDRILTFGLGKRKCLGDVLAKACIFLFFVEILRKYRIVHHEDTEKPTGKQTPGITMTPENYRAKFITRF